MLQRTILITVALCLCVFSCSCSQNQDTAFWEAEAVYTKSEEREPDERFTITTEKDAYSVSETTISYTLSVTPDMNLDEASYIDGRYYINFSPSSLEKLQILREDGWYDVPLRTDTLVIFPLSNLLLEVGSSRTDTVDLSYYFELPLSKGTYRIYRSRVYSNTFTIE